MIGEILKQTKFKYFLRSNSTFSKKFLPALLVFESRIAVVVLQVVVRMDPQVFLVGKWVLESMEVDKYHSYQGLTLVENHYWVVWVFVDVVQEHGDKLVI